LSLCRILRKPYPSISFSAFLRVFVVFVVKIPALMLLWHARKGGFTTKNTKATKGLRVGFWVV